MRLRRLRATGLLLLVAASTAATLAALFAGRLVLAGEVRRARWRARVFGAWARRQVRLFGVEVDVAGEAPDPPFLLVANHLGYVDVVVLAALVDAVFVAKSEVARWPLVGFGCRAMDTIFVERGSRRGAAAALAAIERRLAAGEGVVLFPEGTSTPGETVEPFRTPLLEAAARRGLPVSYASLAYSTSPGGAPAREAVCWWGGMSFPGHLFRLLGLGGFRARVTFGRHPITDRDRKRLAAKLRDAVAGQLQHAST